MREQELLAERKKIIKLLDRINQKDYSAISESLELLKGGKDEKRNKIYV
jgi:hypothetical protein